MTEPDKIQELIRKVSNLESHIINLIIPLQNINKIDEIGKLIDQFIYRAEIALKKLEEKFRSTYLIIDERVEKFEEHIGSLNIQQTYNEIKYIGNRLHQIDESLNKIQESGIKNDIKITIEKDGKNVEKEGYEKQLVDTDYINALIDNVCINSPTSRKYLTLVLKEEIPISKPRFACENLGVSGPRIQDIRKKIARKLRAKENQKIIESIDDGRKKNILLSLLKY